MGQKTAVLVKMLATEGKRRAPVLSQFLEDTPGARAESRAGPGADWAPECRPGRTVASTSVAIPSGVRGAKTAKSAANRMAVIVLYEVAGAAGLA